MELLTDYTVRIVALGSGILGAVGGALGSFAVLRRQSLLGDALSHAALPGMRARRSGLIISISSISGKRATKLGGVGYCASKFGVTGLVTAIGLEERVNGIRVTNIYPGEVDTPILAERPTPVPSERLAQMLKPEDIAACVVTIAKLPSRALVPELVITPLYQDYA